MSGTDVDKDVKTLTDKSSTPSRTDMKKKKPPAVPWTTFLNQTVTATDSMPLPDTSSNGPKAVVPDDQARSVSNSTSRHSQASQNTRSWTNASDTTNAKTTSAQLRPDPKGRKPSCFSQQSNRGGLRGGGGDQGSSSASRGGGGGK